MDSAPMVQQDLLWRGCAPVGWGEVDGTVTLTARAPRPGDLPRLFQLLNW